MPLPISCRTHSARARANPIPRPASIACNVASVLSVTMTAEYPGYGTCGILDFIKRKYRKGRQGLSPTPFPSLIKPTRHPGRAKRDPGSMRR